jgi:hypothetical protein
MILLKLHDTEIRLYDENELLIQTYDIPKDLSANETVTKVKFPAVIVTSQDKGTWSNSGNRTRNRFW